MTALVNFDDVAQRAIDRSWLRASVLLDHSFTVRWASVSLELMLGWKPEDIIGMSALDFLHPNDLAASAEILAFESEVDPSIRYVVKQRNVRDVQVRTPDGDYRHVEVALTNFFDDPTIEMVLLDLGAPTQYRVLDRAFEQCFEGAELGVVLGTMLRHFTSADPWQPAGAIFDEHGVLLAATPNAPAPYGSTDPSSVQNSWTLPLVTSADGDALGEFRAWCFLTTPHPLDVESSHRVTRQAAMVMSNYRSVRELSSAAATDPLTGVANRRALESELDRRRVAGEQVVLVYLDLDSFKAINDRLGHVAGDFVLQTLADRFRTSLREVDLVARVGGDEFVVVLGAPAPAPNVIRERLEMVISAPIPYGDELLYASASIGITQGNVDSTEMLRAADREMLQEKRLRRTSK